MLQWVWTWQRAWFSAWMGPEAQEPEPASPVPTPGQQDEQAALAEEWQQAHAVLTDGHWGDGT